LTYVKVKAKNIVNDLINNNLGITTSMFCCCRMFQEGPMAHAGSIIAAGLGRGRVRLPCKKRRVSVSYEDVLWDLFYISTWQTKF